MKIDKKSPSTKEGIIPNEEGAPPDVRLYTTNEIAKIWGITPWTIRKLVRENKLRPIIGIDTKWRWKIGDLEKSNVMERL
jgi:hypothetical protein